LEAAEGTTPAPHAIAEPCEAAGRTLEPPPQAHEGQAAPAWPEGAGQGKERRKVPKQRNQRHQGQQGRGQPATAVGGGHCKHRPGTGRLRSLTWSPAVRLRSTAKAGAKGSISSSSAALGAKAKAKLGTGRARAPAPPKADREERRATNPYGASQLPLAKAKRLIQQIAFLLRHGLWKDEDAE
jgi:hypothetical protein